MVNKYEINGDVTTVYITSPKHGLIKTFIDTSDLEKVSEAVDSWVACKNKTSKTFYISGKSIKNIGKRDILLHRLVMGDPENKVVDHINHDTLDNRKSNLRPLTNAENQQNRKGAQTNSSSGFRGVHWHKRKSKWEVQIKLNRKKITIGYFDNVEDAARAAVEARNKHMVYSTESA